MARKKPHLTTFLARTFSVSLLLAIGACATSPVNGPALAEAYAISIEKRDLKAANQQLVNMRKQADQFPISQYEQQFAQTQRAFEAACRSQADALVANSQWHSALAKLDACIDSTPNANKSLLKEDKIRLTEARNKHLAVVQRDIDILKAQHWVKNEVLEADAELLAGPKSGLWWSKHRANKERVRLTLRMIDCAEQSFDENNLKLSQTCLKAARGLDNNYQNNDIQNALNKQRKCQEVAVQRQQNAVVERETIVKQQEQEQAAIVQKQAAIVQKQELSALKVRYRQLLKADQLADAIGLMKTMKEAAPTDKTVNTWSNDLDVIIGIKVTHDLERGQALYTQGLIQQALFLWQPLRVLAPNNEEVRANVERAERYLENIDKLDNQPSSPIVPNNSGS